MKLLLFKLTLTLLIGIALSLPILYPSMGSGFLEEMKALGIVGSLFAIVIFLSLVYLYCKDLQKILELIEPKHRRAKPKSVWLMFLIPYNFVEDFFIIYNVSVSLKYAAKDHPSLEQSNNYGLRSGIGWCTAQILSLGPGPLGQIASFFALLLWIVHWHFIRSTLKILDNN